MTTKIRTVIVDDEPLALKLLKSKLSKLDNVEIIGECRNGREAIECVLEHSPDLLFLDIQMPGMNGLEVIQSIQGDLLPIVVFATAYEQYAIDAFNANAVDYILKPIDDERIKRAVERASQRLVLNKEEPIKQALLSAAQEIQNKTIASSSNLDSQKEHLEDIPETKNNFSRVVVKDRDEIHILEQNQIQWIDAAGDYACIHSNGDTHIKRVTLKELVEELDPSMFKRVHRSTIVNLNAITKVLPRTKGEFFLQIGEHDKVKVSRNYKEVVKDFLSN